MFSNHSKEEMPDPMLTTEDEVKRKEARILGPMRLATQEEIQVAQKDSHMEFEAFEHKAIGDVVMKKLRDWYNSREVSPSNHIFQLLANHYYFDSTSSTFYFSNNKNKKLELTAGDIMAFAGDFFGIPESPICEGSLDSEVDSPAKRFKSAFNELAKKTDPETVEKLKNEIDKEYHVLLNGIISGALPSNVMVEFEELERVAGRDRTFVFNSILAHENFVSKLPLIWAAFGSYVNLLRYNFDHFGNDARIAFRTGFDSAVDQMRKAIQATDEKTKAKYIFKSVTRILFACHFLTDLFAAGHIRTPRKMLFYQVRRDRVGFFNARCDYISGRLAHEMHDEDNEAGLYVKSAQYPEGWHAFGDKCHFNPNNINNREKVIEAALEALKELLELYQDSEKEPNYRYENYIPQVDDTKPNHYPMFAVIPGSNPEAVSIRGDLMGRTAAERVEDWCPVKAWNYLKNRHLEKIPSKSLALSERESVWAIFFRDMSTQVLNSLSESYIGDQKPSSDADCFQQKPQ